MNQPSIIVKRVVTKRVDGKLVQKADYLAARHSKREPSLPPPTIAEMAKNFAGAMTAWAASGFKTVDESVYRHRLSVCRECPYWKENARGGLGKCEHPSCGCSKAKHWLQTSVCPAGKW